MINETSLSIIICPIVCFLSLFVFCSAYEVAAWHGQASGTRSSVKSGLPPLVPVLEPEGWTLGNPAYSLRSTSSGLLLSFLCHVVSACLFPLSLFPRSLSFPLPVLPHTCTWVFHVHGCVGMWSMWPLRHSCAWYWCEVQLGVCRGYCLFGPFAAL